jgi:hypothetical protein
VVQGVQSEDPIFALFRRPEKGSIFLYCGSNIVVPFFRACRVSAEQFGGIFGIFIQGAGWRKDPLCSKLILCAVQSDSNVPKSNEASPLHAFDDMEGLVTAAISYVNKQHTASPSQGRGVENP